MRNISGITCVMLTFSVGAHAMDSGMPNAMPPESVPQVLQFLQTAPLASAREDVSVISIGENEASSTRLVIVVQLQPADPIVDQAAENMAALQYDGDWESRRQDRLARFRELAARNVATAKPAVQTEAQRILIETAPNMNVFASNYGYGLGYGWPMHF